MAMSRSFGGRSSTAKPPIRIVPPVAVSRPAISLRRVDFPQPEGPTRTMNSPSSMVRSMPWRTFTVPNALRTPLISIEAMPASFLALDRAGGQALHEVFLDEDEEQERRDERHDSRGHHLSEVDRELADEGEETDRERALVALRDQHQREEELTPRRGEDEAEGGGDAGQCEGHRDLAEGAEAGIAVDHRRFLELLRDAVEEGLHQEGREGHVEGRIDDDQAGQAVGQA